jgi:carbon-monoxide dehydrogenase small subunit
MNRVAVRKRITFTLNGESMQVEVPPAFTLLEVLRNVLHLTGTKDGCSQGECGACTVLFNGKAMHACLLLMAQVEGGSVTTIEGLVGNSQIGKIQTAYAESGAVQCGYCTPGFVMATKALLLNRAHPTAAEVRDALRGNLCRCTGYTKIIDAVQRAAMELG